MPSYSRISDYWSGKQGAKRRDGNRWYVVGIPAEAERDDDMLGRNAGERIWPKWFGPDHFTPFKRNPRTWTAPWNLWLATCQFGVSRHWPVNSPAAVPGTGLFSGTGDAGSPAASIRIFAA